MPLTIPALDDRKYQDLFDEALARIPIHNPEWTNFNKSDPGVTLIEVFSFLTENLLYRSNQIPERNRRKFLTLLGIPLQPATPARGLVTFTNERGPLRTITLNDGLEVRAGQLPFRTARGLDVLPVEAQVYYKRALANPPDQLLEYYRQLYASYRDQPLQTDIQLYETVPLTPRDTAGVDIGREAIGGALWVALLVRAADRPPAQRVAEAREAIAGKTLSLGVVPVLADASRRLGPAGEGAPADTPLLHYEIPSLPEGGSLPAAAADRVARYQSVDARAEVDVLSEPGIVEISLPTAAELGLWRNLDPLEAGVGDFPPTLEDTALNDRIITWLRVSVPIGARARLLWVGINTANVTQRAHMANELLRPGTGEPDQVAVVSHAPIIPKSVRLFVTANGRTEQWAEIDDLTGAGPEIPVPDPRLPPGAPPPLPLPVKVFAVNAEAGEIRFGDGLRGARPPLGATLRVDYDYGAGRAGNVGPGAIDSGSALPASITVSNPIATWGGSEAETVRNGEKQIPRYIQHRDRLVTVADFETITLRTPGVEIGRVEVLSAFNPDLSNAQVASNESGDAPGAITLMVIPLYDAGQPDAPRPDRLFLNTICAYLDQRRLATTELFLRGPDYKPIWVSIGIQVVAGFSPAQLREDVKRAVTAFLSPLATPGSTAATQAPASAGSGDYKGWPLRKPVVDLELAAVVSRVPGVLLVNGVLLAEGTADPETTIGMSGLQLPRLAGISVVIGSKPTGLDQVRGQPARGGTDGAGDRPQLVPVPVIPEECR